MSKLTKRITALLLSGMLALGSASGSVYAAAADVDPGLTSEITEEVFTEEPVETAEAQAESAQTSEVTEEVFSEEGSVDTAEATVDPSWSFKESYPEDTSVEEETGISNSLQGEVWDQEGVDEKNVLSETPQETEAAIETEGESGNTEGPEENSVERDIAPGHFVLPEPEDEQVNEFEQDVVNVEEGVEESFDAAAEEEEADLTLIESTEGEEEIVSEKASMEEVASGTCGENVTWTLTKDGLLSISGEGELYGYIEPPYWKDFSTIITDIIVDDGITFIPTSAFSNLTNLLNVTLPDSLSEIGMSCFSGCNSLTQITIPKNISVLPDYIFNECSSLKYVDIQGEIIYIGKYAFYNCSLLERVAFESGTPTIGDRAFYECINLTSICSKTSISSAGIESFYDCVSLEYIKITGNGNIGDKAFYQCGNLRNIEICDGIKKIGNSAFYECSSLRSVSMPNSLTDIGYNAFYKCKSLSEISIPGGVKKIFFYTFYGCRDLKNVYLGEGISIIDNNAFGNCLNLKSITIPGSVTTIGEYSFEECSHLESLTIESGCTSIGKYAFCRCYDLQEVIIPDTMLTIGEAAFYNCHSIKEITIPSKMARIERSTFSYCSGLTNITIPDNIRSIGEYAFINTGIKTLTIPRNMTSIEKATFSDCHQLETVFIHDEVSFIEDSSFSNCASLKIIGSYNSYSRSYADIHGIPFIDPWMLQYAEVSINTTPIVYSGLKHAPDINVTLAEKTLVFGTDYLVEYENNVNAGEATVIISGKGLYSGVKKASFEIQPLSIESAFIDIIKDIDYCGKEILLSPIISVKETKLIENQDYSLSYNNNINAGTATIIVSGIGNDAGTKTTTFNIIPLSIDDSHVENISDMTYTGNGITQSPVITLDDVKLKPNIDYIISYSNNVKVGVATITITGKGNYTGKKTSTFKIVKASQKITAKSSSPSVAVGKTTTVSIAGAKGTKSFKSSNTGIATVDSNTGKVTAKKVGTVKITATSAATANYNAASKTVTIKVVPAATASLKADNQATGIKLTWKKVTGANGYKIYRGSTLIKTITSGNTVTFADTKANTNGTKYVYKVVAKAATGDSTLSKSVAVYRVARPAISSVTNSAASKMTVKWGKNAKATGYQIQYSTDKTFKTGNKAVTVAGASAVSKVIGSLTKSKTYYIRIRTYKTVGSAKYWSVWSAAKSVKITK